MKCLEKLKKVVHRRGGGGGQEVKLKVKLPGKRRKGLPIPCLSVQTSPPDDREGMDRLTYLPPPSPEDRHARLSPPDESPDGVDRLLSVLQPSHEDRDGADRLAPELPPSPEGGAAGPVPALHPSPTSDPDGSSPFPDREGPLLPPQDVDDEMLQHMMMLGSHDPNIKLKALSALAMLFAQKPGEEVVQIVPQWAFEYRHLSLDYSTDVRRATVDTMSSLFTAVTVDGLPPYLKSLIGPWWFCQFDPAAEVAQAGQRTFQAAFPQSDVSMDPLMLYVEETLLYLNENLKLTTQALSEKGTQITELEDMHDRLELARDSFIHKLAISYALREQSFVTFSAKTKDYEAKLAELTATSDLLSADLASSQAQNKLYKEKMDELVANNKRLADLASSQAKTKCSKDKVASSKRSKRPDKSDAKSSPAITERYVRFTEIEVRTIRREATKANGRISWVKVLKRGKRFFHSSRRPGDIARKWKYMKKKEKG